MASSMALPSFVRRQFKAAQSAGDLTFYSTQVAVLSCYGLPFQIRFSPALANKPKSNKSGAKKSVDPFETPQRGLFISNVGTSHYLVLNKFPIIPNHFILATTEFKEQTDLLEEEDIGAAYECLKAYRESGEELFGFFNSGDHSGASQPHRHIQFLPVESMHSGIEVGLTWNVLADKLTSTKDLPFQYFVSAIPQDATPSHLHSLYVVMHEAACRISQEPRSASATAPIVLSETRRVSESPINYNLGLTDRVMVLFPRVSEGIGIETEEGKVVGPISINGTILGGTLLVKSNDEWETLRSDPTKLKTILSAIGIQSTKN
ncbi:hypothetical protein BJ875DRAFT_28226 [Amylocarpus encephaloides]|uniref:HIT domain-containing protein n=1 Tax=Amylocarpus encephaloides TaxID=45428 RepID=A0A9P8C4U8_9HELO|nr:hypothetical protein BJ875DRAFT_28226 [Amylocarpus encephaloides]